MCQGCAPALKGFDRCNLKFWCVTEGGSLGACNGRAALKLPNCDAMCRLAQTPDCCRVMLIHILYCSEGLGLLSVICKSTV